MNFKRYDQNAYVLAARNGKTSYEGIVQRGGWPDAAQITMGQRHVVSLHGRYRISFFEHYF